MGNRGFREKFKLNLKKKKRKTEKKEEREGKKFITSTINNLKSIYK